MIKCLPGTTYPAGDDIPDSAFSLLRPALAMTGGLTLAQVRELTGLESSTIQNWVKRGWVAPPAEKKYQEAHLARIIIINMLRGALQLDKIASLMRYVNGEVNDRADDIIPDSMLYDMLCVILMKCEQENDFSDAAVWQNIKMQIAGYQGPFEDSRERLTMALSVMISACIATSFKQKAEALLDKILE